jgi:hypothetical protein
MQKYVSGETFVLNLQWVHAEDTWEEDDSDVIEDAWTITFNYELGDVCGENLLELKDPTPQKWF